MAEPNKDRWHELPLEAVPDRMSFVPGTERNGFDLHWRECSMMDRDQVSRIVRLGGWRPSQTVLIRYLTQTGWTIRAAFRNNSSIVALYAGEFLSYRDDARLNCYWVHPDYHASKIPLRLLQLARLEMPERPLTVMIPSTNEAMQNVVLGLGLQNTTDYDVSLTPGPRTQYEFRIASVAGQQYRTAVGPGGTLRDPTAGSRRERRAERRGTDPS